MEMEEGLKAILKSNVEALKIWLKTEEDQAFAIAQDATLRDLAGQLQRLAQSDLEALKRVTPARRLCSGPSSNAPRPSDTLATCC